MGDPVRQITIKDYDYTLPAGRIASFPLPVRDDAQLLIMRHGDIMTGKFSGISRFLPAGSLLVINETKVIRARLLFSKPTGSRIEIFCLEPLKPVSEIHAAFLQKGSCTWKCLVGNRKRWKEGGLSRKIDVKGLDAWLYAEEEELLSDGSSQIRFKWEPPALAFSEILDSVGDVPLPPYITRETIPEDILRYQTVYARDDGSVAAPTAGLHFTGSLQDQLMAEGFSFAGVTLHVGVGTFRPVTSLTIGEHEMHSERITVSLHTIETLTGRKESPVIAVGTTSARTLESLYWMGTRLLNGDLSDPFSVGQWDPYREDQNLPPVRESLECLASLLRKEKMDTLNGETRLLIAPGYKFRVVQGLITNFHMPQSTLLLMVAALTGPAWRSAYQYALAHDFRFLSYGDACLFFP
jgi:S-adenosylmethionine:tRNA ribosyltransferase-isomerase